MSLRATLRLDQGDIRLVHRYSEWHIILHAAGLLTATKARRRQTPPFPH